LIPNLEPATRYLSANSDRISNEPVKALLYFNFDKAPKRNESIFDSSHSSSGIVALFDGLHPIKTKLIRFGNSCDGGYLLPDDLLGVTRCLSAGVGVNSSFELDVLNRGIKVSMADYSVEQAGKEMEGRVHRFDKVFIDQDLAAANSVSIEDWISTQTKPDESELLLQMDIEGAEIEVLSAISEKSLRRFRIMIVEFHHLNEIWNPRYFEQLKLVFSRILHTHYCTHVHPNNWEIAEPRHGLEIPVNMEFTFSRKDRIQTPDFIENLPNPLDKANFFDRRNISLADTGLFPRLTNQQ
jgi:FkbM family methyltransferase